MAKILCSSIFLPLIQLTGRENNTTHQDSLRLKKTVTSFSFLKYPFKAGQTKGPWGFVSLGLGHELFDPLIYRLCCLSVWAKNSHPVPSELRHDCFLQAGGFLFSSVRISVESLERHYLFSVNLFPKGKGESGMLIKQQ